MKHMFVSYSRSDTPFVEKLVAHLKLADIAVWVDHEQLRLGTSDWEKSVRQGVSSAAGIVYVASPNAAGSRYVRDELTIAQGHAIPVYPIWANGSVWIDCIPIGFGSIQYVDAREERRALALEELIREIRLLFSVVPEEQAREIRPLLPVTPEEQAQEIQLPSLRPWNRSWIASSPHLEPERVFFGSVPSPNQLNKEQWLSARLLLPSVTLKPRSGSFIRQFRNWVRAGFNPRYVPTPGALILSAFIVVIIGILIPYMVAKLIYLIHALFSG